MITGTMIRARTAAFTLIELIVVMAITVILLGLIFGPMIQGFNLTNRARVQVLAQDSARQTMEIIQRDISNGVFVFDNSGEPINLWVRGPNSFSPPSANPDNPAQFGLVKVPFGMVDFVPPARAGDQNATIPANQVDPTTGLAVNRGDVALPLAPGRVIVRYWLGLRNNASITDTAHGTSGVARVPYLNFYDSMHARSLGERHVSNSQHNPVLLYRAIVSPYLPNLDAQGNVQVDGRLFHTQSGQPVLYDANFFYDTSPAQSVTLPDGTTTNQVDGWRDENGDGVVNVCENWHAAARAMAPTERADEVTLDRDDQHNIIFDTNGLPRVNPQIRFTPTYVGNDAGAGTSNSDTANESPSTAPTAYQETNGAWTRPYRLYMFRSSLNANPLKFFYYTGEEGLGDGGYHYNIREQTFDTGTGSLISDDPVAFTVDPVQLARGRYMLLAGRRPDALFTVDIRRGLTNCAFPDYLVLHSSTGVPTPSTYYPQEPNKRYDDLAAALQNPYRMISLATLDDPAILGALGLPALNTELAGGGPRPPLEVQPDGRTYIPNMTVVPGAEIVRGPDMRPGPHYGQSITYTRVPRNGDPTKDIGANEYMINYANRPNAGPNPDPIDKAGTIILDSQVDAPGQPARHALPVNSYDPTTGALTGPAAPIVVTYQIQNNQASDVVKADYLTRQLMTIALGVRLYDFNSGQPQQVTLTQKIRVRNLQR